MMIKPILEGGKTGYNLRPKWTMYMIQINEKIFINLTFPPVHSQAECYEYTAADNYAGRVLSEGAGRLGTSLLNP